MTPERWEKLADLHRRALERPEDERAEFLAGACAGDDELRQEVESLLAQPESGFLEKSPLEGLAAGLTPQAETGGETLQSAPMTGRTITHYHVIERIGAGGMGEVYRARDTKLQRDVALKILPQALAHDADRMARFEREAQVLASLNHPNIAAIHGLEESNGIRALVMELVEGQTLAERISVAAVPSPPARSGDPAGAGSPHGGVKPPLQIDDALPIAHQIAEALEYAHERGVIHRDLKPANVKITPEGTVKVLDFGLAKVLRPQDSSATMDMVNSPTLSDMATKAGMILGTAAYMSPEQAKGQRVDRRCDIWAFGCVLYEMLTGQKAFTGETLSDVLASVIRSEPEWDALPATTPPSIQRLIRRCLQKDQRQRLQAIGEARITIEETSSGTGVTPVGIHVQDAHATRPLRRFLPWAIASLVAGALISGLVVWKFAFRAPQPQPLIRFTVSPPENETLVNGGEVSLSPDGRRLAFVVQAGPTAPTVVWVRSLDSFTEQPIPGTDGGEWPFWSPDGNDLGFYANGNLEKVALAGGPPQTLGVAQDVQGSGATWSKTGVIVYTNRGRLFRMPESGGTPRLIAAPPDAEHHENDYLLPQFLPDGRHFLFLFIHISPLGIYEYSINVGSLDSKKVERLATASSNAFYSPPGYLLYMDQTKLTARPFDAGTLKFTGPGVPIAEGVARNGTYGGGHFAVSQTGTLAYGTSAHKYESQMVWLNRQGKKLGTVGPPGFYGGPALSPDGTQLAVVQRTGDNADIWIYNLKSGTASRLTFNPSDDLNPVWSTDGSRIFFTSYRLGQRDLYEKSASGLGNTQLVFKSKEQAKSLDDVSRNGRYAIYDTTIVPDQLWVLPLFGERKPFAFVQGKVNARSAQFSPNSRYVAYNSRETGRDEVYVQTFPQHTGKWQISTGGGVEPMWRGDGRELFFLSPDDGVMAVQVNTTAGHFQAGTPKLLFKAQMVQPGYRRNLYVVSPDGKRFLMLEPPSGTKPQKINVVLNWPALLKNAGK